MYQPTILLAVYVKFIGSSGSSCCKDLTISSLFFSHFGKNSKFFQFVSKMSRGELIIEDNQVKQGSASQSDGWADEFQTQYNANANSWADQFAHEEVITERWVYIMLKGNLISLVVVKFLINHWYIMVLITCNFYASVLMSMCGTRGPQDAFVQFRLEELLNLLD